MATTITGTLTDANKTVLDKLEKDVQSNNLKKKQTMGQEQFLHLITEQLKNQDPMAPMQDQQFIAQMAQLQALESQNSLLEFTKASYLMNVDMSSNLKTMNDNIKKLVEKMTSDAGTGTGTSSGTNTTESQNVVNELIKINKALESYFTKQGGGVCQI